MAKPLDLPRWAETAGGTPASNIIEPESGKKDTGFVTVAESPGGKGDVPTSGGMNWWMWLAYKWTEWVDDFASADGTLDWSQLGSVGAILKSAVADGASAIGFVFDTLNTLSNAGAKLHSWKNGGTEKAYLDKDGRFVPSGLDLLGAAAQSIIKGGSGVLEIATLAAQDIEIYLNSVLRWTFRESDGALTGGKLEAASVITPSIVATSDGTAWAIQATGSGTKNAVYALSPSGCTGAGVYGATQGAGQGVLAVTQASGPGLSANAAGTATGPAGQFQSGSLVRGPVNLVPMSAPSAPQDGDIWVETGTNTFKVRINGTTRTVTVT